jgi:hypothetical protein
MTTITVNVPVKLTEEMMGDIMCTALEGGIGYWCAADDIVRKEREGGHFFDYASFMATPAEEDDEFLPQVVTYATIAQGVQRILACDPKPHVNSTIYAAVGSITQGDAGGIDADAADAIIQVGLFGELVYG